MPPPPQRPDRVIPPGVAAAAIGFLVPLLLPAGGRASRPGVNYVGGSRQLRRRVPAPHPLPWQGVGRAWVGETVGG
jgi:hypothetical protein